MEVEKRRKKPGSVRKPAQPKAKPCSFQVTVPEAKVVTVAGDFNQWNPHANPLKRGKEGVWKVTLRLQPGTYQYKFVVNGEEWQDDPLNPNKAASPYGSFNSVHEVA